MRVADIAGINMRNHCGMAAGRAQLEKVAQEIAVREAASVRAKLDAGDWSTV